VPFHNPHDEEDSFREVDWEWRGPDGLTDSERNAYAERFHLDQARTLTPEEVNALRSLRGADMLPKVKLEELPT